MALRGFKWSNFLSWTVVWIALGLGFRSYHYVRDPSMWHDEAAVVLNILGKSYAELLGPLAHGGNGPPLFLWAMALESWLAVRKCKSWATWKPPLSSPIPWG